MLLQHRAEWSHHGGTWGILGGARDSGETAARPPRARRRRRPGCRARPTASAASTSTTTAAGAYTTVIGHTDRALSLTALTAETIGVRWVPADAVVALPLHPGFAATWESSAPSPDVERHGFVVPTTDR